MPAPQAIVTADAGSSADWYGQHIRLLRGMLGDLSGRLASMLAAMPYATAATFAYPERSVICTIGDGAFQMLGMNELITMKKYIHDWEKPQLIILVLHNNDLTLVSWEMRTEDANPVWSTSQDVQSVAYAGWAELLGFTGLRVKPDSEVARAWDAAFAHQGVTIIDAYTTKNVPPLPPHITMEFLKHTAEALFKKDPDALEVMRGSAKGFASEGNERAKGKLHIVQDHDETEPPRTAPDVDCTLTWDQKRQWRNELIHNIGGCLRGP
ncbi:thiamine pyrophosphate-dependent enzyme [Arthrobacter sp. LAPM80]|uniref:thiamine pyrophosphate-dependent enzyme n=1 Tax=Arthrobacter sp. LAPM80 TaxID=3141788 RepID=UPI00398B1100